MKKVFKHVHIPQTKESKKTYWYGNPGIVLERTIVKVYPELLRTLERCIADYFQCKQKKLNCIYCHCVENPQHSLKPKLLDTTCVLWLPFNMSVQAVGVQITMLLVSSL